MPTLSYILMARSRARVEDEIVAKHARAVDVLRRVPPPWGPTPHDPLPLGRWGGRERFRREVNLTGRLGKGIEGEISFCGRDWVDEHGDDAQGDDYLTLEFGPAQSGYRALLYEALPAYVEAIDAYSATVEDAETMHADFERWRQSSETGRHGVFRIQPANYWDRELCRRAWALTPEEVVVRLGEHVESARVFHDGALVVVTSEVLPTAESERIDGRLRPLLARA